MVPSPGRASPVVASVQSHKNFVDHADLEIVPSHENSVDLHSVYSLVFQNEGHFLEFKWF
jgi:hypothetical protein